MGWNEVRVSLVPMGRKIVTEVDLAARTTAGDPVAILHSIPDAESAAQPLDRGAMQRRLEQEGFDVSQQGESFLRMKKGEIEAFIGIEQGMVSEVIVTFTLNRSSLSRAPDWQRLICHLVESDELFLVDRRTQQSVGGDDFLRVLTASPAWRQFAKAQGWLEMARENGQWPIPIGPSEEELPEEDGDLAEAMFPTVEETWLLNEAA
jgi:hypothetical protein